MRLRLPPLIAGLALGLLEPCWITPLSAAALPSPSLIPHPSELDIPYSAENPPGPSFAEEERRQQLIEGQRIRSEILQAFHAGHDGYTIPPGNYRFDAHHSEVKGHAFALEGLRRDPAKPFRIQGYGATFWFNLEDAPAPHAHEMIKLFDCSFLSLEGLTVDSDPRGCMDARVTAFDFEGNRIQVKPVAGTRLISRMPAHENRFVPFKANGHHLASLYQIDSGWGPGNVMYDKLERTEDGLYWFTLRNEKLLETVQNPRWRAVYGSEGTLEIGDMLGFVYSTSSAITLSKCKRITVRDCRFHAAKACLVERDGDGDHRWLNCHFTARPGTNNLLGGDGTMNSCMHGATFDGGVIQRTTDDAFNSHGRWNHAEGVGAHSMTFRRPLPPGLLPGHTAEAFDTKTETFIQTLTVKTVEGKTVIFEEPVGERFANAGVLFRELQNVGWAIRNSIFSDCYQRIRLMCGPGIFENNLVERVGAGLAFGNGRPVDPEGGLSDDVIIRNNVFIDSALSPTLQAIQVRTKGAPVRNLEVSRNLVCNTGSEALYFNWVENLQLRDNLLIHPGKGRTLWSSVVSDARPSSGIVLERIRGARISGNTVVLHVPQGRLLQQTDAESVTEEGNRVVADPESALEREVRKRTERHDRSALAIVEEMRPILRRIQASSEAR